MDDESVFFCALEPMSVPWRGGDAGGELLAKDEEITWLLIVMQCEPGGEGGEDDAGDDDNGKEEEEEADPAKICGLSIDDTQGEGGNVAFGDCAINSGEAVMALILLELEGTGIACDGVSPPEMIKFPPEVVTVITSPFSTPAASCSLVIRILLCDPPKEAGPASFGFEMVNAFFFLPVTWSFIFVRSRGDLPSLSLLNFISLFLEAYVAFSFFLCVRDLRRDFFVSSVRECSRLRLRDPLRLLASCSCFSLPSRMLTHLVKE